MRQLLESYFPFFEQLDEQDKTDMAYYSYTQQFKKDETILTPDDLCFNLIIVLSGRLRSILASSHPILLYYLNEGEICTLASSRELYGVSSMISLIADTDCRILKTPSWLYLKLKDKYPQMSYFLRKNFMDRFADVLYILRSRALLSSKENLASYLYDLAVNSSKTEIEITQEKISRDIALARSQVSILLSDFEKNGIITTARGKIIINDLSKLGNL